MSFALTINRLENALKEAGCPLCRLERQTASQAIDTFLWENVNDPQVRGPVLDAHGFCQEHTLVLVAAEMSSSGPVIGVNIVYKHLGENVSKLLAPLAARIDRSRRWKSWLQKIGAGKRAGRRSPVLPPKGICPICASVHQSSLNILATLFEQLENDRQNFLGKYRQSDGVCLRHLRMGLEHHTERYPHAAQTLVKETRSRLDHLSGLMGEYLRKNNWAYKHEKISADESAAWRQMLTFFSGYPGDKFTFRSDEF